MTERNKRKPAWQTRKWWEELIGIYRDERIDAVNRVASRNATWVKAVLLTGIGIYQIVRGDWMAALTLASVVIGTVHMTLAYRQSAERGRLDEFGRRQYLRQYMYVSSYLLILPLLFWLGPLTNSVAREAWSMVFAVSVFVALGTQLVQRAFPLRTWLLALVVALGGGAFGFMAASDAFSQTTLITVGILYALLMVAATVYWYRRGGW